MSKSQRNSQRSRLMISKFRRPGGNKNRLSKIMHNKTFVRIQDEFRSKEMKAKHDIELRKQFDNQFRLFTHRDVRRYIKNNRKQRKAGIPGNILSISANFANSMPTSLENSPTNTERNYKITGKNTYNSRLVLH